MAKQREYGTGSILQQQYRDSNGVLKKTKTLYIQYYDQSGKRVRKSAETEDRREAQRKLTEAMAAVGSGRASSDNKGLKYETVRDAWVAYPRERGAISVRSSGLPHVDSFFKDCNIADVSVTAIDNYIASRRTVGDADATIRRQLRNLQAILNYAHDEQKFGLANVPSFKRRLPVDSKPRQGFITPKDFSKLKSILPTHCGNLALFQYRTGFRTGAALKITWDMLNHECDELHIPAHVVKNNEPITLPLVGDGLEEVSAYFKKLSKNRLAGKQLFDIGNGGSTLGKEAYRYHWNKACNELGFGKWDRKTRKYTGLRPHDMRRSAVKNMMAAGISRKVAMQISGHKTESVFNRYHIVETEDVRNALVRTGQKTKLKVKATRKQA